MVASDKEYIPIGALHSLHVQEKNVAEMICCVLGESAATGLAKIDTRDLAKRTLTLKTDDIPAKLKNLKTSQWDSPAARKRIQAHRK